MFDERVQIIAGIRRQSVSSFSSTRYASKAWTPAVTLLVKPLENMSVYANYIQGLQPGTVVGSSYANVDEVFPPYKSRQYEAGIKIDWGGRLMTTMSVYQIKKPNTMSIPGEPLPTLALDGEQRNRGIELNIFGAPTKGLRLNGGISFIKAELSKTQGGVNEGNQVVAVPKWRASLNGEWDVSFLPGLTVNARVSHADKAYIDAANTQSVKAWTLWDIGARYSFALTRGTATTLRLNIENLFDKNFWTAYTNAAVIQNRPRTLRLSASFDF
jgi:iron complex outermembrane receptor protein